MSCVMYINKCATFPSVSLSGVIRVIGKNLKFKPHALIKLGTAKVGKRELTNMNIFSLMLTDY